MTFLIAKSMGQSYNPQFLYAASRRKQPDTFVRQAQGQASLAQELRLRKEPVRARLTMKYRHGINP
jgi:hypothetical protein